MSDTNPGETVTGEWVTSADPRTRCDRTILAPPGPDGVSPGPTQCRQTISGATIWLETHLFEAPTMRHKSYVVVTCETCRLLDIAHEWADAGDVPPFAYAQGCRRGWAGTHSLSPDQYTRSKDAAERLIDERTTPDAGPSTVPDAPLAEVDPDALQAREGRKVRAHRDSRRQLAG